MHERVKVTVLVWAAVNYFHIVFPVAKLAFTSLRSCIHSQFSFQLQSGCDSLVIWGRHLGRHQPAAGPLAPLLTELTVATATNKGNYSRMYRELHLAPTLVMCWPVYLLQYILAFYKCSSGLQQVCCACQLQFKSCLIHWKSSSMVICNTSSFTSSFLRISSLSLWKEKGVKLAWVLDTSSKQAGCKRFSSVFFFFSFDAFVCIITMLLYCASWFITVLRSVKQCLTEKAVF